MSYGAMFMLGAAYALSKGAHVRTDMLWEGFSDRTKGLIDAIGYILFFMPTMIVLFWISIDDFFYAMSINERSNTTLLAADSLAIARRDPAGLPAAVHPGHLRADEELVGCTNRQFLVHQEKLEL